MYEEDKLKNIEAEDSRTKLIRELTEEVNEQNIVITQLRKQIKKKFDIDDPNLDITADIKRIGIVINHLTKHMKLTRDVGAKARLGNSISSNHKIKNVLVQQVIGLNDFLDKNKKLDRKDHRFG